MAEQVFYLDAGVVPIQPYLPWEIRLYLDILDKPLELFTRNEYTYEKAIDRKRPLTVNHFRKAANAALHPDERGDKFVWEADEVRANDDVIPPVVLVTLWNNIVNAEQPKEFDRPEIETLKAVHKKLFDEAQKYESLSGLKMKLEYDKQ